MLTVDARTGGVATQLVKKPVSVSEASSPEELLAFVMNRIVVVSQRLSIASTFGLFKVANVGRCEEKTSSPSE